MSVPIRIQELQRDGRSAGSMFQRTAEVAVILTEYGAALLTRSPGEGAHLVGMVADHGPAQRATGVVSDQVDLVDAERADDAELVVDEVADGIGRRVTRADDGE